MIDNGLGLLAGMVLGGGHFALFRWSTSRLLLGGGAGRFALLAFLALRQIVLVLAFLAVWRGLRLPPLPMALGVALAWLLLRIMLVWSVRRA